MWWITREETFEDYDVYETEPSWSTRWLNWIGSPKFTIEPELLEHLRPDLKLVGGPSKRYIKKIKRVK